jgi:hypothetical protein
MGKDREQQKGTLCPCGILNFNIADCEKEKRIGSWNRTECGFKFEVEWNE